MMVVGSLTLWQLFKEIKHSMMVVDSLTLWQLFKAMVVGSFRLFIQSLNRIKNYHGHILNYHGHILN